MPERERPRSRRQLWLVTGGAAAEQNRQVIGSRRPENELGPSAFPHICRVYREQARLFTRALMIQWKNNFLKSRHLIRDAIFFFLKTFRISEKTFKEIIVEGNVYETNKVSARFISLTISETTSQWT